MTRGARELCLGVGLALGLALVALAGAGCGPVRYLGQVHRADAAVDAARAAHADRYAPYWWTRATQYLHKARELAGHADFQGANRFGQLAADAASLAEQEAVVARKAGTERPARPGDDKRPIAPASDTSPLAPAKDTP